MIPFQLTSTQAAILIPHSTVRAHAFAQEHLADALAHWQHSTMVHGHRQRVVSREVTD